MRSTPILCGKPANTLFTQLRKIRSQLSTGLRISHFTPSPLCAQADVFHPQKHTQSTTISTHKIAISHLLNNTFTQYPHPLLLLRRNK